MKTWAAIDGSGNVVDMAGHSTKALAVANMPNYDDKTHTLVEVTGSMDPNWRIGDTVIVDGGGHLDHVIHRQDTAEETAVKAEAAKRPELEALKLALLRKGLITQAEIDAER